ncbi:MAG: D-alanyl-D-alanine carboxypeptidase [Clostridiales bacterium]|nr:D-alanyl-D-alanine carboxypeptidase [Clostridiales bacterium]
MRKFLSVFIIFGVSLTFVFPCGAAAVSHTDSYHAVRSDSFGQFQTVAAAAYTDSYPASDFKDFHQEDLTLYASSAVLIDADSGRILYGKSATTQMANASTTKILTCILALEEGSPDDVVTVSDYACSMPQVKLGFSAGDSFYLRDLLLSLMLESHNDTAVAIAEHIAGSVEDFAEMMNQKAEEIGCMNSHFVTPNGLDGEDEGGEHRTTAYDLSLIMSYCIRNEEFLAITQTASAQISTTDGTKQYSLTNHNSFLDIMDGALSGKTGFTAKAGYCYVGAYQNGEHIYTFALLACGWPSHREYKWSDAAHLIDYANNHYSDRVLLSEGTVRTLPLTGAVAVRDGEIFYPDRVEAAGTDEIITGFVSDTDEISVLYDLPESLAAPVEAGAAVGTEKIYLNGVLYAERKIVLTESAENFDFSWCLHRVIFRFQL